MAIEFSDSKGLSTPEAAAQSPQLSLKSLFGNASPEDAKVVGFAETHKQATHYVAISARITELAQPGDILLVEGVQRGEEVPQDSIVRMQYRVPRFVRIEGWDDIPLAKAADEKAKEMLAAARAADQARGTVEEDMLNKKAEATLAEFKAAAVKPRNTSLLEAVTDAQTKSPEGRTFVVAGALHFAEDPDLIGALGETKFSVLKTDVSEAMQQRLADIRQRLSIIGDKKPTISYDNVFKTKNSNHS